MIIFSDYDGTISIEDMLDKLIDFCESKEFRLNEEQNILDGKKNYNDVLDIFLKHINISFDHAINILNNNNEIIDNKFYQFYNLCLQNKIPLYIVSSGIKKIILHYLSYIETSHIYANDANIDSNNKWTLNLFKNIGINKFDIINDIKFANNEKIYIGDGLSDICIIDIVDKLFVKNNSFLHKYCKKNNKRHIVFNNFEDIINMMF